MRILLAIGSILGAFILYRIIVLRIKSGVNLEGVTWRMFYAAIIAEGIFAKYGSPLVITSANDSKHMAMSKHYEGNALDFRTWDIEGRENIVASELEEVLGDNYDVVIETDHLHVEYDPHA